jgi:hypothetical protein
MLSKFGDILAKTVAYLCLYSVYLMIAVGGCVALGAVTDSISREMCEVPPNLEGIPFLRHMHKEPGVMGVVWRPSPNDPRRLIPHSECVRPDGRPAIEWIVGPDGRPMRKPGQH